MKTHILLALLLCMSFGARTQEKHVIRDSVSYRVSFRDSVIRFDPDSVQIKVIRDESDSLHFFSSEFKYQFEILNETDKTLLCNKEISCWNDSGLSNCSSLWGDPLILKPNEKATVTIDAHMYSKIRSHSQRDFILIINDETILIPITFDYTYIPIGEQHEWLRKYKTD